MKTGIFYGISVGPGDPELITVKGARLLSECRNVFVPKARIATDSLALEIARRYVRADAVITEMVFPMTSDQSELDKKWLAAAQSVAAILETGDDACFLSIGDVLFYSTFIYLLRALKQRIPDVKTVIVPGVPAFNAAAALTEFELGVGKNPVTVIPASDDLSAIESALAGNGTVIIMKIGSRLQDIIMLLERRDLIGNAVFVSHAGLEKQMIETNLRKLKGLDPETGYLSIVLVHCSREGK